MNVNVPRVDGTLTKYVALLRGISPMNPDMRNDKLSKVMKDMGFVNVHTVISSGNVVFESDSRNINALEVIIEKAWPQQLGLNITTTIRSQEELLRMVASNPFKGIEDTPTSRLNVTFLKNKPTTTLALPYQAKGYAVLHMSDRAIFTVIDPTSIRTPDVMLWLEKQFGKEITTRTWKTVHRILKKMREN